MRKPNPETHDTLLNRLLDQSLQFHYESGSVTNVPMGEVASWRTLPCANIAFVSGGRWRIEREDTGEYFIASGEASCIPAGILHRSFMMSQGSSESRWAHFNVLLCGYIDLLSFFEVPRIFRGPAAERIGEILSGLALTPVADEPFSFLLNRKILEFELAAILISHSRPRYNSELRLQHVQRVLPVLQAIDDDIAAPYTRASMAKIAHLSPSRFAAVFKEAVGIAPIDYLTGLRMQRARQLLNDSGISISQIAAQVGYRDAFYFSRLFKAHFGISPKQFQSASRNSNLN